MAQIPRARSDPAQQRRAELDAKVAKFHAASDGVYGARASWPIYAMTVSGSRARRWRPHCAAKAWPGSAPAVRAGHHGG
ncbi:integrase, catalytic region domain protein [Mycobacterium xenopi 4042]|uniref:Integrase, catalytic region domain protein n=1 Tax=Mycobacterium xenopi 4042 TaxID=1299334 RepID=X8E6L4_MYCXE|nr:integrase, catalytic region domain protein [Mycobacterium xenopi 4042]